MSKKGALDRARNYDVDVIQIKYLKDIGALLEEMNENLAALRKEVQQLIPIGKMFPSTLTITTTVTVIDIAFLYTFAAFSVTVINDGPDVLLANINDSPQLGVVMSGEQIRFDLTREKIGALTLQAQNTSLSARVRILL